MIEKKNIELLGIGNAVTDVLVSVDYEFLDKENLSPGTMQLVDAEALDQLIKKFKKNKISAGGSVANTVSLVAYLEINVHLQVKEKMTHWEKCLVKV